MKWLIIIIIIAAGVWYFMSRQNAGPSGPEPNPYHRTVANKYFEALRTNDNDTALFYSTGRAKTTDTPALIEKLKPHQGHFANYELDLGGAPGGDRVSGWTRMFDKYGNVFLTVDFTMQKIDGNWYISAINVR